MLQCVSGDQEARKEWWCVAWCFVGDHSSNGGVLVVVNCLACHCCFVCGDYVVTVAVVFIRWSHGTRVWKEWSGFDVSGRNHAALSNVRFGVSCGRTAGAVTRREFGSKFKLCEGYMTYKALFPKKSLPLPPNEAKMVMLPSHTKTHV